MDKFLGVFDLKLSFDEIWVVKYYYFYRLGKRGGGNIVFVYLNC